MQNNSASLEFDQIFFDGSIEQDQPISLIKVAAKAELEAWIADQDAQISASFQAQSHLFAQDKPVVVINQRGERFVLSPKPFETVYGLAQLCQALPQGRYAIDAACLEDHGEEFINQLCCAWALEQYRFTAFHSQPKPAVLRALAWPQAADRASVVAQVQAQAMGRDLINRPANDLTPEALAQAVKQLSADFGAQLSEVVGEALLAQNFPAIHAVGRAAMQNPAQAPRFLALRWGDQGKKVTLVGKGLVYDTGGLNIKPGSSMALMKKDMGGAAAAMALARMIMQLGLPVQLELIIGIAENSISGQAMRPGDVLQTRAGYSIEITNTDAEGRLVLADCLSYAGERDPDLLLDFATLTGAARVALGTEIPAIFTPDQQLARSLMDKGQALDAPLWSLPLHQGYIDHLSSQIADFSNAGKGFAGAISAALFLQKFVPKGCAWLHCDTYAWNDDNRAGRPKGGEVLALSAFYSALHSFATQ